MAGMGTGRHLETGSTRPPAPAKDVLRVYGMKFCPFTQRLMLCLAAKEIEHETINISLVKKPEWYFDINPRGKVPSLEKNGDIIYESDLTSNYVDEAYPGRKLTTADPLKRAYQLITLGDFGPAISNYYGLLGAKTPEKKAECLSNIDQSLSKLEAFLQKDNKQFFCGSEPGMTDYMIWPHLERIVALWPNVLENHTTIEDYAKRMEQDPPVIACRHTNEHHKKFLEGFGTNDYDYDIGTVTEYNF